MGVACLELGGPAGSRTAVALPLCSKCEALSSAQRWAAQGLLSPAQIQAQSTENPRIRRAQGGGEGLFTLEGRSLL